MELFDLHSTTRSEDEKYHMVLHLSLSRESFHPPSLFEDTSSPLERLVSDDKKADSQCTTNAT